MAEEKPKEDQAEAAAAPATGGGFKAWLPLIIVIVLMPALAFGTAQYVILPQLQKALGIKSGTDTGEAKAKAGKDGAEVKKDSVIMNKLLVNVAGTMGARYLLVSLTVVGSGADFKTKMADNDAQLRDAACSTLAAKTLADLEKPGARNLIRNELITDFNGVLGDSVVQEIYLTEFAIQ